MAKNSTKFILVILYLILGVYFINFPFNFFNVPESILNINEWIVFAGGILMLYGAVNYLRAEKLSG